MSLSDRLKDVTASQDRQCKLMNILNSSGVTKNDRETFLSLMSTLPGTPGRVTNVALASALRAEGYDIADNAVDRHRRGSCSCNRPAGK